MARPAAVGPSSWAGVQGPRRGETISVASQQRLLQPCSPALSLTHSTIIAERAPPAEFGQTGAVPVWPAVPRARTGLRAGGVGGLRAGGGWREGQNSALALELLKPPEAQTKRILNLLLARCNCVSNSARGELS